MQLADFDFDLPDALIARYPPPERRASRLLVVDPSEREASRQLSDRQFGDLTSLLRKGDLLVFNDTRVIKARLDGTKASGGRVEILVERVLDETTLLALVRAGKAPKVGSDIHLAGGCEARVVERVDDLFRLELSRPVLPHLDAYGAVPLPPYLRRDAEAADVERYQTVYARKPGAVAAPTAGLHFDDAMLRDTAAGGVRHAYVTLHVGAGTFQSLRQNRIDANRLHRERVVVDEAVCRAVQEARTCGGRVIAVGTTSVRALEAASASGELQCFDGDTDLFIMPGHRFRQVDAMLTNFHLPQSSLLILVSAFAGRNLTLRAYRHAIAERYRFYSYGDAMLIGAREDAS